MIIHENRLLADDSHEISYHLFFKKLGKMSQNLSSAAVVIGAIMVNWHVFLCSNPFNGRINIQRTEFSEKSNYLQNY